MALHQVAVEAHTHGETSGRRATGDARRLTDRLANLVKRAVPGIDTMTIERARRDALFVAEYGEGRKTAAYTFLADILNELFVASEDSPDHARDALERAATALATHPELVSLEIGLQALWDPRLLMLSPKRAAKLELAKLTALVPVASAELWLQRLGWPLAVAVRVGAPTAAGQAQIEARAVIETGQPTAAGKRSNVVGVRVLDEKDLLAALLLRPVLANRARARLLAHRAAAFLAAVLIRADVLQENAECERALSSPAQRRLQGLGHELHDGALQGLAALAQEVQELGRDLEKVVPQAELARILDHVEDLEAGLHAIDADLREVVRHAGRPAVGPHSLRESLEGELAYFRAISEIEGDTALKGDFDGLTPSQRAAAVRVVQEALRNVRKHSSASRADLHVVEDDYSIVIEIVDYGQGFNVEAELGQAAETGRLGLIGMSEQLRIAGGVLSIDSRAGGPTSVRATLPRWTPAASQQRARR